MKSSLEAKAAPSGAGSETDHKPCFFVHFFLLLDVIDTLRPLNKIQEAFFNLRISCVKRSLSEFSVSSIYVQKTAFYDERSESQSKALVPMQIKALHSIHIPKAKYFT